MNATDIHRHIADIRAILDKNLPETFFKYVAQSRSAIDKNPLLKIAFGPSSHDINGIRGQKPELMSFALWYEYQELAPQHFGGSGGRAFHIKPDPDNPAEKYLAYASVKVPFRKPKWNEKAVYGALERFCQRYVQLLRENAERLPHKQHGDYSFLED